MKSAFVVWADGTHAIFDFLRYSRWTSRTNGQTSRLIKGEYELVRDAVGDNPIKKAVGTMLMWSYPVDHEHSIGFNKFASTRQCARFYPHDNVFGTALFTGKQSQTGLIGTLSKTQISSLLTSLEMMNGILGNPHIRRI